MNYNHYGTINCIKCGKPAITWCGHVKGRVRMALGNLITVNVLAGWCSEEHYDSMESDSLGCYGTYDKIEHGELVNVFDNLFGRNENGQ